MEASLRLIKAEEVKTLNLDPVDDLTRQQAKEILDDVRENGDEGLRRQAERLKDLQPGEKFMVSREELKTAFEALPADQRDLLERTAERIRKFATVQRESVKSTETDIPGGRAGQDVAVMKCAGCYAPGGRYPLPSSVLMTAVTARVAGVERVIVASPRPQPITLGAAYVAGADSLLRVGGAQAIGALAYGKGGAESCDVIVGPGNRWVTAAKQIVNGVVAIDMLAGPSECLVIADSSADASIIAADLLAQAEHDTDARPILLTVKAPGLVGKVNEELTKQLSTLSTAETARVAVTKGFAVEFDSMEEAIAISDMIGPEHLEIITANAKEDAEKVGNYGGLFVGTRSAEVFGDYGAGPNHVLPTSGTARYTGGLSVFTFLRIRTWMRIDNAEESQTLVKDAATLARLEGLEGHARAAEKRLLADAQEPEAKKLKA